jgi:hypothetical protein
VSDFMRVARSFAWQQSMAMRGYARMGVVVCHPQSSRDVLDEALEVGDVGAWHEVVVVDVASP